VYVPSACDCPAASGGEEKIDVKGTWLGTMGGGSRRALACVCAVALLCAPLAWAERTKLKPGWNVFSPQDDIKLGAQNSKEADQQLPLLHDAKVDNYLSALGKRLAGFAPGDKYPYQFKCVNTREINAFALPGGYIYVNRGTIEAADDEAQLAAVMGHEISHVALRHGTNQATKAILPQLGLGVLGSVLGDSAFGQLLQVAGTFSVNSLLLKYSRTDESQADILGTQIVYDAGYDPRGMAQFFEKLEVEEKKHGAPPEFFSNHPSPEHRIERVNEEIQNLDGPPPHARSDSAEFRSIKSYILSLPPPPKQAQGGATAESGTASPGPKTETPSTKLQPFQNDEVALQYPANWRSSGQGSAVMLGPEGGMVPDGHGGQALAYGVIINLFEPHSTGSGNPTLQVATDQLIDELRHSNSGLSVQRRPESMRLAGAPALSAYLLNDSPKGGRELIWLVTSLRPDGLLYLVCVAPQKEYDQYDPAFQSVVRSLKFRN
jgi:hypothetical protein